MAFMWRSAFYLPLFWDLTGRMFFESRLKKGIGRRIFIYPFVLSKRNFLLWKDPYTSASGFGLMAGTLTFPSNAPVSSVR